MKPNTILEVKNLGVEFGTYGGSVRAVRGVSFSVRSGSTLAIVGESGCGKSVTVQSIMGLIPQPPGRITSGSALLAGRELLGLSPKEAARVRAGNVGMIFQEPMTSLNPTMTIGNQISESLRVHKGYSRKEARNKAIDLLELVRVPEAAKRIDSYPFEFSGGMRQRAMIAMAVACEPKLLIADEPTTALDVTIQAQIIGLLKELQSRLGMSIILITHDLGVVASMADDVAVMYAGQIVESGTAEDVFYRSSHPYTVGLKAALPHDSFGAKDRLIPIAGSPPDLFKPPHGCGYAPRCPHAMKVCTQDSVPSFDLSNGHTSLCWLQHAQAPRVHSGLHQREHIKIQAGPEL